MSENLRMVSDATFDAEVKNVADIPVFVDFWAPWCGPCRMLAPLLEEAAQTYQGRAVIAKYNVDESSDIANDNGIRSIPTILVYKNGVVIGQHTGAMNKGQLAEFIEQYC